MKNPDRLTSFGILGVAGLVLGYALIFCFYAAGLFGDGSNVSARVWERALRGTILLGPFLGAFLLLGYLAWRGRWSTGVLPWTVGSTGVLLLARKDAGILSPFDAIWVISLLAMAVRAGKHDEDEEDS